MNEADAMRLRALGIDPYGPEERHRLLATIDLDMHGVRVRVHNTETLEVVAQSGYFDDIEQAEGIKKQMLQEAIAAREKQTWDTVDAMIACLPRRRDVAEMEGKMNCLRNAHNRAATALAMEKADAGRKIAMALLAGGLIGGIIGVAAGRIWGAL